MNLVDIGQNIRERRKALNLTQAKVAELAGISRATLNKLETGAIMELGATRVLRVLTVLGLSVSVVPIPSRRPTLEDRYAEQTANARILQSGTQTRRSP